MPITKIEYTDTSHTSANYTYDDGTVESAPYPAQNGPTREAAEAFLAAGGTVTPFPVPTLAQRKAERKAELAAIRFEHECKGYTWARAADTKTYIIGTDRESQPKLSAERTAALANLRAAGDVWKCYDPVAQKMVFLTVSNAEVEEFANACRAQISACFKRECVLDADIDAATTKAAVDAIDLTVGWP